MSSSGCPSDDRLRALLLGRLSHQEARECESHVIGCELCRVRMRDVQVSAPLLELLPGIKEVSRSADDEQEARQMDERFSDRSQLHARSAALGQTVAMTKPNASDESSPPVAGTTTSSNSPSAPVSPPAFHVGSVTSAISDNTQVLQPAEGAALGAYRLEKKLGEGGMGAVWKAFHTKLKKRVAVKVLSARLLRDASLVARFEREMEAVGRLDHPGIVRAMDAGEVQGTHYLVMEYVEGADFGELVKTRGERSVHEACELVCQAAIGLAYAHRNGLVHRDIKPSNLLLTKEGQVKILDLGLARLQGDGLAADVGAGLTGTGQILGTPDYMAPEQWENTHTVSPACDLYALGCTLFFLLTGRAPFADDKYLTLARKMMGHVHDVPPILSTARADIHARTAALDGPPSENKADSANDIPQAVEAIYQRLMAKDPADRFTSADELVAALTAVIEEASPSPPAASPPSPLSASAATPAPVPTPAVQPLKASSRSKGPWIWSGILGAALMLGVTVNLIRHKDGSTTPLNVDGSAENTMSRKADAVEPASETQRLTQNGSPYSGHGWPAGTPKPAIAPFDAAQAKTHQEDWAAYLNVPVEYANSIGMTLRLIPPGEFLMGSTPAEVEKFVEGASGRYLETVQSQVPQHKVVLTRPIYLGITEVTQSQYLRVMGKNPSHFSKEGMGKDVVAGLDTENFPVESISWDDASAFTRALAELEMPNRSQEAGPALASAEAAFVYRLPTEAEWEFACRVGVSAAYGFGDMQEQLPEYGWYVDVANSRTHPVGELKANPFGLFDTHGNVWEWVQDPWENSYYARFTDQPAINPWGPEGDLPERVYKGGGWGASAESCRAASRPRFEAMKQASGIGFRVVMSVDAARRTRKME